MTSTDLHLKFQSRTCVGPQWVPIISQWTRIIHRSKVNWKSLFCCMCLTRGSDDASCIDKIVDNRALHNSDAIMSAMASQITGFTIVYSTVCSGANQRKHQSSVWLAFEIHRWPVNSLHEGPVTRKMFPFDDVIMDPWVKLIRFDKNGARSSPKHYVMLPKVPWTHFM